MGSIMGIEPRAFACQACMCSTSTLYLGSFFFFTFTLRQDLTKLLSLALDLLCISDEL